MTKLPGFTLIELLLAFGILAVLATTSTVILAATLRSSARAAVSGKVRNEGEYLMESIVQLVRYSFGVTCAGTSTLNMARKNPTDIFPPQFTCAGDNIASNSARISSREVVISGCSFTCSPNNSSPTQVKVGFTVQDVDHLIEPLIFDTNIILRNTQ